MQNAQNTPPLPRLFCCFCHRHADLSNRTASLNSLERSGLGPALWLSGPKLECCAWHSQSVKNTVLKQSAEPGQRVAVVDFVPWASALMWDGPVPVPCFSLFSLQNVFSSRPVHSSVVFLGLGEVTCKEKLLEKVVQTASFCLSGVKCKLADFLAIL